MAEYDILIQMALTSGRETFVTDASMYTLWTNSDRRLSEIMVIADKTILRENLDREIVVPLKSGELLRQFPLKTTANSDVKYFLYEILQKSEIIHLACQTEEFKNSANDFAGIRTQLFNFACETSVKNGDLSRTGFRSLISGISSKTALLNILSYQSPAPCSDVTVCLMRVKEKIGDILRHSKNCRFTAEIQKGLKARANTLGLAYAVADIVAYLSSRYAAENTTITLTAAVSTDGGEKNIVISADAALENVGKKNGKKSPKTVWKESSPDRTELTVATAFAKHFGGKLILKYSESRTMVRIVLPYCDENCEVAVHSPKDIEDENRIIEDIVTANNEVGFSKMYCYPDPYITLLK